MTKDQMLQALYVDYVDIKDCFEADLDNLQVGLVARTESKLKLQRTREELKATESAVVLAETHKEGMINGKNAETRARQTTVLLAHFRANDADAYGLTATIADAEDTIAKLDVSVEVVKARLYSYQATSRMIAGLAAALGGTAP